MVCWLTYHIIDKLLYGIVVTDVNGVKVYREVDILPHVVIMFDMVIKAISTTLKLMTSNTADETNILLVLFCSILQKR